MRYMLFILHCIALFLEKGRSLLTSLRDHATVAPSVISVKEVSGLDGSTHW